MDIASIIILISAFLLLAAYFLYPLFLSIVAKFSPDLKPAEIEYHPEITIIMSAYNERDFIGDAVESVFKSGYSVEKINLFVGSDGSTDATCEILKDLAGKYPRLKVFCFDRIGKNAVINALTEKVSTEVVFYMDADVRLQPGVIEKLLSFLADEKVGAVIASMKSVGSGADSAGGYGELLYQKIEKTFRINESKISSTVNALGAFYGVKTELIEPLPDDLVADDFYPLLVVMQKRKKVLFIDEAEVLEVRPKSTSDEINRRIRASASAMSSLKYKLNLLLPHYGWVAFFLFCHKILRWAAPIFLLIILIATFFVENKTFLFVISIIQLYFYLGALIGYVLEKRNLNFFIVKLPLYTFTMNLGFLGAILRFITGKKNSKWQRN